MGQFHSSPQLRRFTGEQIGPASRLEDFSSAVDFLPVAEHAFVLRKVLRLSQAEKVTQGDTWPFVYSATKEFKGVHW